MTDTIQDTFGFEKVAPPDRQERVNGIFSDIAGRYDLMNDVMSAGLHRLWKEDLLNRLDPDPSAGDYRLLDMAGGSGDIAIRFAQTWPEQAHVTLADINPDMLGIAQQRINQAKLDGHITCAETNAEALDFDDATFDAYTIALGIRNVTRLDRALSEACRVLKPGGRFLCLEFGRVTNPVLKHLYDVHSFKVIPRLGQLFTGRADPYVYLVESIRCFPSPDRFSRMISAAGFTDVSSFNLMGGIAVIYSAWKPE